MAQIVHLWMLHAIGLGTPTHSAFEHPSLALNHLKNPRVSVISLHLGYIIRESKADRMIRSGLDDPISFLKGIQGLFI
jgi:hypothetical protein